MKKILLFAIAAIQPFLVMPGTTISKNNGLFTGGNVGHLNCVTGDPHAYSFTNPNTGAVISFSSNFTYPSQSQPVGIKEITINANVKVFPNPASKEFTVEMLNNTLPQWRVQMFDISGKKVLDELYSDCNTQISMISYAPGLYIINVLKTDNTIIGQFKIVKQ